MKAFKRYFTPDHADTKTPQSSSGSGTKQPASAPEATSSPADKKGSAVVSTAPSAASAPSSSPLGEKHDLNDLRTDVVVHSLWQDQLRRMYASAYHTWEGAVLKKARNEWVCAPPELRQYPGGFYDMVCKLNVRCAITVSTPVIYSVITAIGKLGNPSYVPISGNLKLQVLPRMSELPRCHKHHFAAFILDPPLLVVWDDEAERVLARAEGLEKTLIRHIWSEPEDVGEQEDAGEKKASPVVQVTEVDPSDPEKGEPADPRPIRLVSPLMVGITLALSFTCIGLGWRHLAMQTTVDGNFIRLALVAVAPFTFFVSLFFFQIIVSDIFQIAGPISYILSNSRNYSGKAPPRLDRNARELPHVTIQMPVYKEGLGPVIRPTVLSLKAAISTYEMQGGTANIFVNDDGMQLLPEDQARARRDFYEEHSIGWVARPGHNPRPEGGERPFLRRGRFKKASNMNYGLMVSNRIEDKLSQVTRSRGWTQEAEDKAYAEALASVLEEDEGRTWAEGNIRVGDYILLIDSDTRVPEDCLLDAASEMEQSPEIAILQYSSGVMNVSDSFFEKAVTWFTNLIYTSIKFSVANGDIPPFVGHNAVLRWTALQDAAAYMDEEDGYEKFWSESHVSEDFDMALRLQTSGYALRFGAYPGDGFKEGVSLTVYDELARWEKYAYGVNELLFHPFRLWIVRGPFTPLFRRFLGSNIHMFRKLTILAYIGTYYAIGISWMLTLMNYFLTGWMFGLYDKYYLDSFAIYVSIIVVFPLAGNVALAVLRYRLGEQSFIGA
ncbi:hypothetical protein ACRALDRAFT_2095977, partial [Sodiomyces alcalophilus JCM 7366]|uniref:uncharacterized protein n=1 Tax=Sodiomyces alcalophilus JCM 7366 TaxID=591952 RepID=UPI0039B42E6E